MGKEILTYFQRENAVMDLFVALSIIIAIAGLIERGCKAIIKYFKAYYNKRRGVEKKEDLLVENTKKVDELNSRMDRVINAIEGRYDLLIEKMDEQNQRLDKIDIDGKRRDCTILRDRILGGMRYFSQNVDEYGNVHISMTDHENMEHMFKEYFDCGGNGSVQVKYENEFKKFIID